MGRILMKKYTCLFILFLLTCSGADIIQLTTDENNGYIIKNVDVFTAVAGQPLLRNVNVYIYSDRIKKISPDLARDIIMRMARIDKVTPDAVMEISRVIRKKFENIKETEHEFDKTDGIKTLVNIMGQMNYSQEKHLLDHFEINNPNLYTEIRENIFTFDICRIEREGC